MKTKTRYAHDFNIKRKLLRATFVHLEYPGCGKIDTMTKAEFARYVPSDFPEGTRIWTDEKG